MPPLAASPGHTRRATWMALALALALAALCLAAPVHASTPAELRQAYSQQAGQAPSAERGRLFFTQTHGREWRCASCHGEQPLAAGRHASTGKAIRPLAPAAEPARFTDPEKVEKWFGRNCKDVLGRACSPAEKADVMSWLMGLQP